jgi:arylsulfatase A-like enzyme
MNRGAQFIKEQVNAGPWMMFVNVGKPHLPSEPPTRYRTAPVVLPPPSPSVKGTAAQLASAQIDRTKRARALMAVDDGMETLMAALTTTGELDNTIVVFTSDNGFLFYEHGKSGKAEAWEEASVVPTVVRWPGVPGRTITDQASWVDLTTTILGVGGAEALRGQRGVDLTRLITASDPLDREWVYMEGPNVSWRGVRSTEWKYVRTRSGAQSFYDLTVDPYEMTNRISKPEAAEALADARAAYAALLPT